MLTAFINAGLVAIYYGNKNKAVEKTFEAQGPLLPQANIDAGASPDQGPPAPSTATPDQKQYNGQSLNPLDYANGSGFLLGKQNESSPYGPEAPVSYVTFTDDEAGKV